MRLHFLPSPLPSHFLFLYPPHTETDTPPSLSSYSRGISTCACPTHSRGGSSVNEWQALLRSSLTPVRASSVVCVQGWKWAGVTQHARGDADGSPLSSRLLNQLLSSRLVCWLGNNNYLLRGFQMNPICNAVMSPHHLDSCDAVDVAWEMCTVSVRLHTKLQMSLEFMVEDGSIYIQIHTDQGGLGNVQMLPAAQM